MNIVEISLPFDQIIPKMFCPVCGAIAFDSEGTQPSCPHVLFVYHDVVGEFDYVTVGLKDSLQKAEEMADECDDIVPVVLTKLIKADSSACFKITGHGMACGPLSYSSYVAVEFAAL